jgi:hypothetical protein
MCLDSTNKLEQWYVRHNNVYCLHLWATCFNLYTGHLQEEHNPTNDKTHKAPYPLTSSREHTYRNPAENIKKYIKNMAL